MFFSGIFALKNDRLLPKLLKQCTFLVYLCHILAKNTLWYDGKISCGLHNNWAKKLKSSRKIDI